MDHSLDLRVAKATLRTEPGLGDSRLGVAVVHVLRLHVEQGRLDDVFREIELWQTDGTPGASSADDDLDDEINF